MSPESCDSATVAAGALVWNDLIERGWITGPNPINVPLAEADGEKAEIEGYEPDTLEVINFVAGMICETVEGYDWGDFDRAFKLALELCLRHAEMDDLANQVRDA